jgi:hypothetical protein
VFHLCLLNCLVIPSYSSGLLFSFCYSGRKRSRQKKIWDSEKIRILLDKEKEFGSTFYKRPEMKQLLPGVSPDAIRVAMQRYMKNLEGGGGLGGGTASSQGKEGGGQRKTSGKGRPLRKEARGRGGIYMPMNNYKSPKRRIEGRLLSSLLKVRQSTRNDKKDHGRDKEREDAEDMREFKTCCWECKSGRYMRSRCSTKQCRKVRWILLSCYDAVLCVSIMIICLTICYDAL